MNFYIHIPFCRQKCPYCKFALTPIFDAVKKQRYLAHLKKEIREYFNSQEKCTLGESIYFGGGTPSILTIQEIRDILDCFPDTGDVKREISFECNPEDIQPGYIQDILSLGIGRISLGIQSLNDTTLKKIHRSNTESIIQALSTVGNERGDIPGSISINIDFILGLPSTQKGETLHDIKMLHKTYPWITHTSVYMLEDGLYPKEWKSESLAEEEIAEEYSEICTYFDTLDWNHYEISNWSKKGYECQHNLGYWNHVNYRGFGLSATSYIDGKRWENSHSFQGYYQGILDQEEYLTPEQITLEKIIFGIRTFSLEDSLCNNKIISHLEKLKLIERKNNKICLTPAGIFQENTIISQLIE